MGWCSAGSSGESCDQTTCVEIGATYEEKRPTGCLLLSVMDDDLAQLLTASQLYPPIIEFREDILPTSPVGRRMSKHFDRFYEEAVSIAKKDRELVTDIVWTMTYVTPFLRALLGQDMSPGRSGPTPTSHLAERLRPQTVEALTNLVERFRASASEEFEAALVDFQRELDRFTGLTPPEALIALRKDSEAVRG